MEVCGRVGMEACVVVCRCVGMEVRLAEFYPGALLLGTRSVDYSLLAKLHFSVPGGPWQALEETPACTVSFSRASFSPAVGRGFSKVVVPPRFFHLRAHALWEPRGAREN